jgi:ABC-type bacteriocin/lantibiotic exporter with double-glycine peptidase domain
VGYVGQEPVLFNTSIRENMLMASPKASDAQIEQALRDAKAWKFIQKMDKGIETNVGGSAGGVSGGQK